jgi:hypothetical protein
MSFMRGLIKNHGILYLFLVALLIYGNGPVSAYAPLDPGSNVDLSNATMISNPEKSYTIYSGLHEGGEAQYYHFQITKGETLYGSVQIPGPYSMVVIGVE